MKKIKKGFIRFLVGLIALQGVITATVLDTPVAQANGPTEEEEIRVVINEVMWMGSYVGGVSRTADEWIELYNPTSRDIDLSGWSLSNTGLPPIPGGKTIAAGGYFLISNFSPGHSSSALDLTNQSDWVTTSLSLDNTCQPISLTMSTISNGMPLLILMDRMGCDGNRYFEGENDTTNQIRRSMERTLELADGNQATSWQTSVGFYGLRSTALDHVRATPRTVNDSTAPSGSELETKLRGNEGYTSRTADPSSLRLEFGALIDTESKICSIEVGIADEVGKTAVPPIANVAGFVSVPNVSPGQHILDIDPSYKWHDATALYPMVLATNCVNLKTLLIGQPIIHDATAPPAPTNVVASDLANDDGNAMKLTWEIDPLEAESTEIKYRQKGVGDWTILGPTKETTAMIDNLKNYPVVYEFELRAIDFAGRFSLPALATGSALDNLAPTLDATKVTLVQNPPGTPDAIFGSPGAVSEPADVFVFARDPALDPTATLIGSIESQADGSFLRILIGDNLHAEVFVRLVDKDLSAPLGWPTRFTNDIVGPLAPTLRLANGTCETQDMCRVELMWQDNGPDTVSYQIRFNPVGQPQRTTTSTTTGILLDLPTDTTYEIVILALDRAGNLSPISNLFTLPLARGGNTRVELIDGQTVVTRTAVPASLVISEAPIIGPPATIIAPDPVRAEAPAQEPTPVTEAPAVTEPLTEPLAAAERDWTRIFIVVILLLIIAGGFYFLSRSIRNSRALEGSDPLVEFAPPAGPVVPPKKTRSKRRSRRRN